jgi:RNA polymerase sigma-70 factor, ECF subfamily
MTPAVLLHKPTKGHVVLAIIPGVQELSDQEAIHRVLNGETSLYEIMVRRYNQRIYRIARAILHDNSEAEDVMQDAYVRAYKSLSTFQGKSSFATWLARIAVNEALQRKRRNKRMDPIEDGDHVLQLESLGESPEQLCGREELRSILEHAIAALPQHYRVVVMLRDVEEMTTAETAEALELSEENVRIRLHRGRALLRKLLAGRMVLPAPDAYAFHLSRCDRVVANVLAAVDGWAACQIA